MALMENSDKLIERVIKKAMDGDTEMLKLCTDRLIPRLRAQAAPVVIDSDSDDISGKAQAAIDSALEGEITADVLRDLLGSMYLSGKIQELTELERRLRALEEAPEGRPPWEDNQPEKERLPIRGKRRRKS